MTVGNMLGTPADGLSPGPETGRNEALARLALVVVGFVGLMWWNWSFAVFVVLLLISIALHELGHYLGARWGGMKPTEFFLGFGPRIFSFRRGDTEYGLKPILLGAYVKVPGMTNLEEVDPADEARTFRAQSFGRRFRMVFAGPGMNLALALIGLMTFFVVYDEPVSSDTGTPQIQVADDGPALAAGLRDDDRVVAVDGIAFGSIEGIIDYVKARPASEVVITVVRDGAEVDVPVTLAGTNPVTGASSGYLGVRFLGDLTYIDRNLFQGVQQGFTEFGTQIWDTTRAIGQIFSPSGLADLGRIVVGQEADDATTRPTSIIGISQVGSQSVGDGFQTTLLLMSALNLALGMFNLLPVLPFDGGHLVIAVYERVRSRNGRRYQADFGKVVPFFAPVIAIVLFVVVSALFLDARNALR
ncbi:MAG: M50 family metallopeptidase [Ilumatobacteraceae bacterium]